MSHSTARHLIGQRFSRLTVLKRAPNRPGLTDAYWVCRCQCGSVKEVSASHLRRGNVQSCGCLARERVSIAKSTHRQTDSKEYYCWAAMKQRCNNPKNKAFKAYGGRGIRVCDRWNDSFEAFLEDMGKAPPGTSIDRIDNEGNYEPGNCRWATAQVQTKNRRVAHYMTARGETHLMAEWAEIVGIRRGTIANRLRSGWSDEEAIFGRQA